jgi:hypothetical protein
VKLSFTLFFLMTIVSCSSVTTYNYTEDEFKDFLKVGAIEKVKPDFTCFKDNQLQTRAIYYNFYNMTVEQVYAYAEYIKEDFSIEGGHFKYDTMTINEGGTLLHTRVNGHANLYDKQIAVCTNAALVRRLNRRRHLDYSKRFPVHQTHFNISVKLTKNFVLDKFLKNKILNDKINSDLIKINKNAPHSGPKLEYYCLDDKCNYRKQSTFISERRINIKKEYTRDYLDGAKVLLNYGYISEAVKYIQSLPSNSRLRCLYEETKICNKLYRGLNET